jgi:hypothetical protein
MTETLSISDIVKATSPEGAEIVVVSMSANMDTTGKGISLGINILQPEVVNDNLEVIQTQIDTFITNVKSRMTQFSFPVHI